MIDDARRRTILETAARLFRHYGHGKTTVADIAREAKMGVGTFYLAFPSKEAIVEELSSSAHVRVMQAMRKVADARGGSSLGERLTGVLETRVAKFQELAGEGQHACELVHCTSGPVKGAQARFREEEAALLRELLEDARSTGELAKVDVPRAVALVQRAYATLSPPWLFDQPPEEARRAAAEMSRLVLLGLLTRGDRDDDASVSATDRATAAKRARRASARRAR